MTAEILKHPNAGATVAPRALISLSLFQDMLERMAFEGNARAAKAYLSLAYSENAISEAEYDRLFTLLECHADFRKQFPLARRP